MSAWKGSDRLVQMMLEQELDVNFSKLGSGRALEYAVTGGNESIVRLLLHKGTKLDSNQNGHDAFYRAVKEGHEGIAQMLFEREDQVNCQLWGYPPIVEAQIAHQLGMMHFLLDRGADLVIDGSGEYIFNRAICSGHEQEVRLLINAGVDLDRFPGDSIPCPVLNAMRSGHDHILKILLDHGAKRVDPLESEWAGEFLDGTYPRCQSPPPLLKR